MLAQVLVGAPPQAIEAAPRPFQWTVRALAKERQGGHARAEQRRRQKAKEAEVLHQAESAKQARLAAQFQEAKKKQDAVRRHQAAVAAQQAAQQAKKRREQEERRKLVEDAQRAATAAQEAQEQKERDEAAKLRDEGYIQCKKRVGRGKPTWYARHVEGFYAMNKQATHVDAFRALRLKYPDKDLRTVLAKKR